MPSKAVTSASSSASTRPLLHSCLRRALSVRAAATHKLPYSADASHLAERLCMHPRLHS